MRRLVSVAVSVATVIALAAPTAVFAASPSACQSENAHIKTVVIDGREYGPKDGLKVVNYQCEVVPGSGPVGTVFGNTLRGPGSVTPQITWGSSYAISTEEWQWFYTGKARAAANIFDGFRIIQVCMWYWREADGIVSAVACSSAASSGGSWLSGPEVTTTATDSIIPGDEHRTYFRYYRVTIAP